MADQASASKISSIAEALDILVAGPDTHSYDSSKRLEAAFTYLTERLQGNFSHEDLFSEQLQGKVSYEDLSRIFRRAQSDIEALSKGCLSSGELPSYIKLLYAYLLKADEEVPAQDKNGRMSKDAVLKLFMKAGKNAGEALELIGRAASSEDAGLSKLAMPYITELAGRKNSYKRDAVLKALDAASNAAALPAETLSTIMKYCGGVIGNADSSSYDSQRALDILTKLASRRDIGHEAVKGIVLGIFRDALEKAARRTKPSSFETDFSRKDEKNLREAIKHAGITILEARGDLPQLRAEAMELYLSFCSKGNWLLQGEAVFFLGKALRRLPDVREGFGERVFRAFELLEKNNDGSPTVQSRFIMGALDIQEYKIANQFGTSWRHYEKPKGNGQPSGSAKPLVRR